MCNNCIKIDTLVQFASQTTDMDDEEILRKKRNGHLIVMAFPYQHEVRMEMIRRYLHDIADGQDTFDHYQEYCEAIEEHKKEFPFEILTQEEILAFLKKYKEEKYKNHE